MRKRVTTAAFLLGLAATAPAQSGAEITMPPNSHQEGLFTFANNCLSGQTYKVTAESPADWLRVVPPTVDVRPDSSFNVRVTVNTPHNLALGKYRGSMTVVCATCAAGEPPCLQDARDFPIGLTVANVKTPGEFQPIAAPEASPLGAATESGRPAPYIPPDPPPPGLERFVPLFGGAVLAIGAVGLLLAMRGLSSGRTERMADGRMRAESERHQVRR